MSRPFLHFFSDTLTPYFQCLLSQRTVQHFPFQQSCSGTAWRKSFIGFSHAAASGSSKWNDGFSGEIITFQKCIDNRRSDIPPDRKVKCSQFPSCVDFTGFNCIQNCVYCYYLSFFSKIALKHRPHYFHI